jgi:hypothetical protein
MKTGIRQILFLAAWLPLIAGAQTVISPTTYTAGPPVTVTDTTTITTNTNAVTVSSGANVTYQAGTSITLGPGFQALTGSNFHAVVGGGGGGGGGDTDGDSLPDSWEIIYYGNLTAVNGASDTDNDQLTSLMEYQLGTNPLVAKQNDSGNSLQLQINHPTNP